MCLGQVRNHKGPRCLPLLMHPRVRPLHGARTQCQGGLQTEQNLRSQEPRAGREGGKTQRGQARLGGLQLDAGVENGREKQWLAHLDLLVGGHGGASHGAVA